MEYVESKTPHNISIERVVELFGIISLGYLFFIVIFTHLGFVINQSLTALTLPISFTAYLILNCLLVVFLKPLNALRKIYSLALIFFVIFSLLMFYTGTQFFSKTYDTSWDGQGYQSSGILNLASGWNPLYNKELPVKLPDASILVKGYPKTLWLIQSSIYLSTGSLNTAKIINLATMLISFCLIYTFFRKLKISIPLTIPITVLIVLQPLFVMQFLSFMADGFSYQIILIAIASLGIFALESKVNTSLIAFVIAELFLLGTKYSNLPLTAALGVIFLIILLRKYFNGKFLVNRGLAITLTLSGLIFLMIPYATNEIYYKYLFYPTNIKEINSSFKEDNTPKNLKSADRFTLLFYGIFSQSQLKPMGKDDPQNLAVLKIPFTFTMDETIASASIFNNRVGAAGPLFSASILLSIFTGILMFIFRPKSDRVNKMILLIMGGVISIIMATSLLNPVPNLLRYNSQIMLIPFIVIITALVGFKNSKLIKTFIYLLIITIFLNTLIYSYSVIQRRMIETAEINAQLSSMRQASTSYIVKANNFYSNYIRLKENNISFTLVENLNCNPKEALLLSSYTTMFCANP